MLRKLRIELNEVLLVGRNVILGENGFSRTLGDAQGAIDALVRVNHEEIRAFAKTVHRAHIDAIGELALDTAFGHYISHVEKILVGRFGDCDACRPG